MAAGPMAAGMGEPRRGGILREGYDYNFPAAIPRRGRTLETDALMPSHLSFGLEDGQRNIKRETTVSEYSE